MQNFLARLSVFRPVLLFLVVVGRSEPLGLVLEYFLEFLVDLLAAVEYVGLGVLDEEERILVRWR